MEHPVGTVTVPAQQSHTATVIFIHGLGQSNLTWRIVMIEALAARLPHVQFILPQAPHRHVSMNRGQQRPSWFDIRRLPPGNDEFDEAALTESVSYIENIILSQVHAGLDPRRIVLAGFSQGASLATIVSLTTLHDLGGVASLSGWIPHKARDLMAHTAPNLPVLWCHGTADDEIPLWCADDAISFLSRTLNVSPNNLCYRKYAGLKHAINDEELNDFGSWLENVLP